MRRNSSEEFEVVDDGAVTVPPPPPVLPAQQAVETKVTVGVVGCAFSLLLAGAADGVQVATATFPAVVFVVDAVMLITLLIVWGRRKEMFLVIVPEVIPAVSAFPTWSLFVLFLIGQQQVTKKGK